MIRSFRGMVIRIIHARVFLIVLATFLAGAACVNPFNGSDNEDRAPLGGVPLETAPGTGRLVVTLESGVSSLTILPEESLADEITAYDVLLTDPPVGATDEITLTGLTPDEDFPLELESIAAGTWTLTVQGRNGNESGEIVASFTQTVTITDGDTTSVEAVLRGTQSGTGRLEYTLTWAAGEADDVIVELRSGSFTGTGEETEDFTFTPDDGDDPPRGRLVVTLENLPSGNHFLLVYLKRGDGENAPVIEAAQVYDNRTSRKTVDLPAGALTQPPAAPSEGTVELTGDNQFTLSWTDNAATEEGFRIYQGGPEGMLLATTAANVVSIQSSDLGYGGAAGDQLTYRIVAFNSFGESESLEITFTPIGTGDLTPAGTPGDPSAVTENVLLEWSVFPGAESYNLYISTSQADVENLEQDPAVRTTGVNSGQPASEYIELVPDTTYYWTVEAINGDGSGALATSLAAPVRAFTVVALDGLSVVYTGPDPTNNQTPTVTISGLDLENTVNLFRWVIDGSPVDDPVTGGLFLAPVAADEPFTRSTPILPEGTRTVQIQQGLTDDTFTEPSDPVTITIDITPPAAPDVSGPGFGGLDISTFREPISVSITDPGQDPGVVFEVLLNNVVVATGIPEGTITVDLGLGENVITVTATDAAGNVSDPTTSSTITRLESAAPVVESADASTTNRRPTWTWSTIAELDGNDYRYSFDQVTWTVTAGTEFTPTDDLATGTHTLSVQQQDDLGEWSESGSFTVDVLASGGLELTITLEDPAQPSFILPSPGTVTRGDPVTVTLESDITFEDVAWFVNGEVESDDSVTLPNTTASLSLTGQDTSELPLGINRITVLVVIEGNWYSSEDMTFEVVQP